MNAKVTKNQRDVVVWCECPGCTHSADVPDVDGLNLCIECYLAYEDNDGKLVDKTKYDEDGEPYIESD